MQERYFLLRLRRDGPLVPARLSWCDHEPGVPDNKLDRGRLVPYPQADIAGTETPPEELIERLGIPATSGDQAALPHQILARLAIAAPIPTTHWKYPIPVTQAEYRYQLLRLRWAETNAPNDPTLRPRKAVNASQMALPNFDREHAL